MITEDYVSFEIAQLLKEKGFDISCKQAYFNGSLVDYTLYGFCDGELLDCPSQSLALKWLREVHNIFVEISVDEMLADEGYQWALFYDDTKMITPYAGWGNTYEQAVEAALLYVLKNLI